MSENGVPQYNAPQPDPAQPYPAQPYPAQPYPYQAQYNQVPANVDPLDLPYPGAGPILAVNRFYQNYAKFSGRASRSEFWWVQLVFIAVYIVLGGLAFVLGSLTGSRDATGEIEPGPAFVPFAILLFILAIGSIVPNIAVTVRRLHDAGMPGLLYLIVLFPYLGSFVLLILNVLPPKPEGAMYDRYRNAQPAPFAPQAPPAGEQYQQAPPVQSAPPTPPAPPAPPAPPTV